jgi:hypothetical protein
MALPWALGDSLSTAWLLVLKSGAEPIERGPRGIYLCERDGAVACMKN